MSKPTKEHPLILVCYVNRDMMNDPDIMGHVAEGMNLAIAEREANAMVFFIPTDGMERMECINPVLTTDDQTNKINKMIEEISKSFDIGQGADENLDDD